MRPSCPKRLPTNDSHGTARVRDGVNLNTKGGHDKNANRSSASLTQAQGSSRPGRVYALTQETRTPTALEGMCDLNTGARVLKFSLFYLLPWFCNTHVVVVFHFVVSLVV